MSWFNKNIKFLRYSIGPLLFVWFSYAIYQQIIHQNDLAASLGSFSSILNDNRRWKLWAVLLLMIANWGVEAKKFQVVLAPVEQVDWRTAARAVLTGIAFSISTPNRIGEYPGKLLCVQPGNRLKALSLIAAGNLSQLIITLIMGWCALIFLLYTPHTATADIRNGSYFSYIQAGMWLTAGLLVLALTTYFRLESVIRWGKKFPVMRRIATHATVLQEIGTGRLLQIGGLSLVRYLIFALQYILLLEALQVEIPLWPAFWLVGALLLVLSLVPTIAFAELGIRGQLSLSLFGLYSSNRFGIVAASIGIWVINLLIPALIGSVFVLRIKIFSNR